jgi:poly(A) polymerase
MKLRELLQKMEVVQKKIGSSIPYICGGTPRDKYLKRLDRISDLDITTGDKTVDFLSQEFANSLRKDFNITRKVMDDGHSTIYVGNLKMDFSSNFLVPGIDKLLIDRGINKPTNMQRELFSRDFTCNALLLSLDLKNVIDPTNMGFQDIKNRKIKTCLSPEITLTSNRNRVIRSVYLASKLDFDVDESIISYVSQHPQSVQISSQKSLTEKINEAFTWDADKASYLLTKMNLWKYVPITEAAYPYYMKFGQGAK